MADKLYDLNTGLSNVRKFDPISPDAMSEACSLQQIEQSFSNNSEKDSLINEMENVCDMTENEHSKTDLNFFAMIEFFESFNNMKTSQETINNEILLELSKLSQKVDCIEKKSTFVDPGETETRVTQNFRNNRCHQEQRVNEDVVTKCVGNMNDMKFTRVEQPANVMSTDRANKNNGKKECDTEGCSVCSILINEKKNTQTEYDKRTLCKILKSKSNSERIIKSLNIRKVDKIDECLADKCAKKDVEQKSSFATLKLKILKVSRGTQCKTNDTSDLLKNLSVPESTKMTEPARKSDSLIMKCKKIKKASKNLPRNTSKNSLQKSIHQSVQDNHKEKEMPYEIVKKKYRYY